MRCLPYEWVHGIIAFARNVSDTGENRIVERRALAQVGVFLDAWTNKGALSESMPDG